MSSKIWSARFVSLGCVCAAVLLAAVALGRIPAQAASKVSAGAGLAPEITAKQQTNTRNGITRKQIRLVPQGRAHSLAELTALSDVIVDGVVQTDRCVPVESGLGVVTVAEIQVSSVLKGSSSAGVMYVAMQGGVKRSPNGSLIDVHVGNYAMPAPGNRVVAFLWKGETKLATAIGSTVGNAYVPVNEQLGLYDLSFRIKPFVIPVGLGETQLGKSVVQSQMDPANFVALVKSLSK